MINTIEQEFYKVFEIEQGKYCKNTCKSELCSPDCKHYDEQTLYYPEITDRILLKLICILNNHGKNRCWAVTILKLKEAILKNCVDVIINKQLNDEILKLFKNKVQSLFSEDEK